MSIKHVFYAGDLCIMSASPYTAYNDWLIYLIVYWPRYFTVHPPPPAPSGPKFSYSENCCGSENAMPLKFFWDMEDHRDNFRSGNVFFFQKTYLGKKS